MPFLSRMSVDMSKFAFNSKVLGKVSLVFFQLLGRLSEKKVFTSLWIVTYIDSASNERKSDNLRSQRKYLRIYSYFFNLIMNDIIIILKASVINITGI